MKVTKIKNGLSYWYPALRIPVDSNLAKNNKSHFILFNLKKLPCLGLMPIISSGVLIGSGAYDHEAWHAPAIMQQYKVSTYIN